jgi:exfoliative toxin A/B
MSGLLIAQGQNFAGSIIKEISGVQIYLTTGIIAFVLYNFLMMFIKSYSKE